MFLFLCLFGCFCLLDIFYCLLNVLLCFVCVLFRLFFFPLFCFCFVSLLFCLFCLINVVHIFKPVEIQSTDMLQGGHEDLLKLYIHVVHNLLSTCSILTSVRSLRYLKVYYLPYNPLMSVLIIHLASTQYPCWWFLILITWLLAMSL